MGRPSKVDFWLQPENLIRVEGWAKDGLINTEIASKMGIGKTAFYKWCKNHPELSKAISVGKDSVDRQVEQALLKRCLGYEYEEVVRETKTDKDGNILEKHIKKTTKIVPPDVTAQIFWLKNRKPIEWRDKRVFENEDKEALDKLDKIVDGIVDRAKSETE